MGNRKFRQLKLIVLCLFTIFCFFTLEAGVDLEAKPSKFIVGRTKLEIPGFPHAFNPSIVRWKGKLLVCFRSISPFNFPNRSQIGFVWLNDDLDIIDGPTLLTNQVEDFTTVGVVTTRAEDVRLLVLDEKLYMIYNDARYSESLSYFCRVHCAEVEFDGKEFLARRVERFLEFPGENPYRLEKNWMPFDYKGNMLLAYSIDPHIIFRPVWGTEKCNLIANTKPAIKWRWGELREGTPALKIDKNRYLTFFHSVKHILSVHSSNKSVLHYFIGALTFSSKSPFKITHVSPRPITGEGFYHGETYADYWKPVVVVYPCGFIFDDKYIWMSYGRQDHEAWIVKFDKQMLLNSLIPVF